MKEYKCLKKVQNAKLLSPLILASIGDSVYDLYIRSCIVSESSTSAHKLHIKAVKYVKAEAQSIVAQKLFDSFTEEEQEIFKRGRNAKSYTTPKNTEIADYKQATAFEALIGFLYLEGRYDRLDEVLEQAKIISDKVGSSEK